MIYMIYLLTLFSHQFSQIYTEEQPFYQYYFVLDLEYESALSEILYSLDSIPIPNFVAETPNNGRLHAFFELKTPIYTTDANHVRQCRLFAFTATFWC